MLDFFFGIQSSALSVSAVKSILLLPFIAIALIVTIIANLKRKTGMIRTLFWIAAILYVSVLVELFFFPIPCFPSEWAAEREYSPPSINFILFVNILSTQPFVIVRNLLGNILVFVPLGFLVPYMIKSEKKIKKAILIVIGSSLCVELIQFIGSFLIFRMDWKVVDIDDVIMNMIGGLIGIGCYLMLNKLTRHTKPTSFTV